MWMIYIKLSYEGGERDLQNVAEVGGRKVDGKRISTPLC